MNPSTYPFFLLRLILLFWFLLIPFRAFSQSFIADLSEHLIAITTGFTGSEVVLFGAREGKGDIVLVVEGPSGEAVVRKKEKIGGVWTTQQSVTFSNIPSFYQIATSRPLEEIASPSVLKRYAIGANNLSFKAVEVDDGAYVKEFKHSFIRDKQKAKFYPEIEEKVLFLGDHLFRANIDFPSNVPLGLYKVTAYLFVDGEVSAAQVTPLSIRKIGFNAKVSQFSKKNSVLYGVIAVFGAACLGWLAALIFKKA
ncbi:MAG: TIGR02186 family protein [Alphaproteobacteria bacterium]|nr:TIGR02186 family protein [Alphaproteobacteria bacterium]MBP9877852.1 TIGR02186 family protein [Alphaproteobacteria bacterium]